ncbi:hypothetical protein [Sphaerotilus sp.]|uniref:hypothetical protein n=1 Tax=Sphaerotilus sp. TaxID=2093942 RepID=UPI0025FEE78E|nr:hypothetical protein [Sphaerotilus sp.]
MDENLIVEWRRREVLSPNWALRAPLWSLWSERRSAELWQAVALSLDYDPLYRFQLGVFAAVASTTPKPKPSTEPRQRGDDPSSFQTIELRERLRRNSGFVLRLEAATDQLGSAEAGERTKVSFHDFRRLADRLNWHLPEGFVSLAPCTPSVSEVPLKPVRGVPAAIAHENAVLAKLQELGFEPLALPPPPRGLSSPAKQAVLTALSRDDEDTRYEKAWKRLTKEERIKYR